MGLMALTQHEAYGRVTDSAVHRGAPSGRGIQSTSRLYPHDRHGYRPG